MNFRGTFEHSLDAKHRLTVPAQYRATLAGGVVVAKSPETEPGSPRSIALWVPEDYERWMDSALAGLNPISPRARQLSHLLSSNSWETELDSANRVMLPRNAIEYAGLGKEVTVTGSGTHLAVWDRAAFEVYNEGLLARFTELAAGVDHTA